jgi:hypothetical protein
MKHSPSEANSYYQLVKKFLPFHGNRKFITVCTRARHSTMF